MFVFHNELGRNSICGKTLRKPIIADLPMFKPRVSMVIPSSGHKAFAHGEQ